MKDRRKCNTKYCEIYSILFPVLEKTLKELKILTYKFLSSEMKLKGKCEKNDDC